MLHFIGCSQNEFEVTIVLCQILNCKFAFSNYFITFVM